MEGLRPGPGEGPEGLGGVAGRAGGMGSSL